MMGAVTHPDEAVASYVEGHYAPWRVDFSEMTGPVRRHNVVRTPTAVFADRKGDECFRVTGYLPPEKFLPCVAMGLARIARRRHRCAEAAALLAAVAGCYPASPAPEAVYSRGVAEHETTGEGLPLDAAARELRKDHPESDRYRTDVR